MKRFSVVLLVLAIGCGKRGDPRPPIPIIPQATSDLVVTQRANRVLLSWSYPSLTTAGRSLIEPRRVVVYRYSEPLPPVVSTGSAGPADAGVPRAIAQFASIPGLAPAQFAKLSTRIESIEGANMTSATVGSRLAYEDAPPFRTAAGQPLRYTYAVVTEGMSAKSELSNLVSIVPLDVAVAPMSLTASAQPQGVELRWTAPSASATGAEAPVITGYNIYRGGGDAMSGELPQPINTTAVTDTNFTDTPPYGEHEYRVTAVAASGPPRIESDPSEPARANFRDLIAPPTPAGLQALVETSQIRLIWDPVDAADLAGYNVYRIEAAGHDVSKLHETGRLLFTPGMTTAANFLDTIPAPGLLFRYEVTSVDKSGNESATAKTGWVLVPKTP